MTFSRTFLALCLLASTTALAACGAEIVGPAADESEAAQSSANDVSSDYLGRYATPTGTWPSGIRDITLRADHTYSLVYINAPEVGTFTVRKVTAGVQLRLTPGDGTPVRIYVATLTGASDKPSLGLSRGGEKAELPRLLPKSCSAVACKAGRTCQVGVQDGVPAPICKRNTPGAAAAWKTALADEPRWAAEFPKTALHVTGGGIDASSAITCTVKPGRESIGCSSAGISDEEPTWTAWIDDDGTFEAADLLRTVSGQVPVADPNRILSGSIQANGDVRLTSVVMREFAGPGPNDYLWFKGDKLPLTRKPYALCRTPDVASGGAVTVGYLLACSACKGKCEGGR